MNKNELVLFLNKTLDNFYLTSLGLTLIVTEESREVIPKVTVDFGRHRIDFKDFLKTPQEKLAEGIYELSKAAYRRLITESLDSIKSYAGKTGQFDKLNKASWYQFARVIRNTFSHDFHLDYRGMKKKLFPIVWNNKANPPKEIRVEWRMKGWPVDIVNRPQQKNRDYLQFTYEDALDLFEDLRTFAVHELV